MTIGDPGQPVKNLEIVMNPHTFCYVCGISCPTHEFMFKHDHNAKEREMASLRLLYEIRELLKRVAEQGGV